MPQHGHLMSQLFGPSTIARPAGTPLPQGQSAAYQELFLAPNGDVYFRRNAPKATGGINMMPWPGQAPTALEMF